MRWVPDRTGRFRNRPHYEPAELDAELGSLIEDFLQQRHGAARYPISTDDLTVLIERHAVLDPYADLSTEGPDVEGVTYFRPGQRPLVRIASDLSTEPRRQNRYRTTLTHEFTHVKIHSFLWQFEAPSLPLIASGTSDQGPRCKRETIIGAPATDWMEWQAGYGCGALLMPAAAVHRLMRDLALGAAPLPATGDLAERAIAAVAETFATSQDAARVRLFKLNHLRPALAQPLPM